jgi:DNA-binding transcriptional regulator YiaG
MANKSALCELRRGQLRHPNRQKLPHFPITAVRFREARHASFLTTEACSQLLRVSERTVRGWESGETRIPYAAYKLLRVLKGGRYLQHPHWQHFIVHGATLVTPEGHRFTAGDLGWWLLLVRQAKQFQRLMEEGRTAGAASREAAAALGLVPSETSQKKTAEMASGLGLPGDPAPALGGPAPAARRARRDARGAGLTGCITGGTPILEQVASLAGGAP